MPDLRTRLDRIAAHQGENASDLALRLIDEGLRMAEFRGITFKDTAASGRVPTLMHGPEVAAVIRVWRGLEATGEERIAQTAEWLDIHPDEVRLVIDYCAAHSDDVERRIELQERSDSDMRVLDPARRLLDG